MENLVRYKGIEHGIVTDAPFVGARICAITCSNNCPDCINKHLLGPEYEIKEAYAIDIVCDVMANSINRGIILGGLEWTEQPLEMLALIQAAHIMGIETMVYTHLTLKEFLTQFPELKGRKIYVKCGDFRKDARGYMDEKHDVYLASGNQKIYELDKI